MLAMVGQVPGVNEHIINVDDHEVVEELLEHLIHEAPEDSGRQTWLAHTA